MVTVESSTVNTAETLHEIKGSLAELKQEQEEAVVSLTRFSRRSCCFANRLWDRIHAVGREVG